MFHLMNFTLLVATIGSSMGAQLGAGRLLYAMGRDNVIPEKFFGCHGLRSTMVNLLPPLLGFLVCLYIWWSLRTPAKIAGFIWMSMGVLYRAWKTDLFRTRLTLVSVPTEH